MQIGGVQGSRLRATIHAEEVVLIKPREKGLGKYSILKTFAVLAVNKYLPLFVSG